MEDEWEVGAAEVKDVLGLWVFAWTGDVETAGEAVNPVGQAEPEPGWLTYSPRCSALHLTSPACRSFTSCADSWSCTYIMWAPIPSLMVRGERPDRKSLICRTPENKQTNYLFKVYLIWCMVNHYATRCTNKLNEFIKMHSQNVESYIKLLNVTPKLYKSRFEATICFLSVYFTDAASLIQL